MKSTTLLVMAAINVLPGTAQQADSLSRKNHAIELTYNWAHIGGNVSANYIYSVRSHGFAAGLKWHNNQPVIDNMGYAFRHRGYASTGYEAFGINLGYQRTFAASVNVQPHFFVFNQISRIRFRLPGVNADGLPQDHITQLYNVIETTLGFGLRVRLLKNIWLTQSAGGGIWLGRSQRLQRFNLLPGRWEFAGIIRVGLLCPV